MDERRRVGSSVAENECIPPTPSSSVHRILRRMTHEDEESLVHSHRVIVEKNAYTSENMVEWWVIAFASESCEEFVVIGRGGGGRRKKGERTLPEVRALRTAMARGKSDALHITVRQET